MFIWTDSGDILNLDRWDGVRMNGNGRTYWVEAFKTRRMTSGGESADIVSDHLYRSSDQDLCWSYIEQLGKMVSVLLVPEAIPQDA